MDSQGHAATIEGFAGIDAYTIADAAKRHGAGGVIHALKPQTKAVRFVGRALTARVEYQPHKDIPLSDYGGAALCDGVSPGDVVILDGGGHFLSVFGDLAASLVKRRGGVAAVLNAAARDVEVIDPAFPLFALGVAITSVAGHGFVTGIGEPVSIDGIRIETGDIVSGCLGGIVVLPWDERDGVLEKALQGLESDRHVREGLARGESMNKLWQQHKAPLS